MHGRDDYDRNDPPSHGTRRILKYTLNFTTITVRVGRYLKNNLTIIVKEVITIFDNIAINEIKTMTTFFNFN
jgi:hypothetical protein